MVQKLTDLKETASQTAGPYVHIGLAPHAAGFHIFTQELGADIAGANAKGQRIRIEGVIFDGTGSPVKDALIEVWQANSQGLYASAQDNIQGNVQGNIRSEQGFRGWGRTLTDFETGQWTLDTIKPGPCPGHDGGKQAPHINLWIVARGINIGLHTRLYFADEDNSFDQVLGMIEWKKRRDTLIAQKIKDSLYRFDIKLQGEDETVFFDI